jgi:hypothetical protein
MTMESSAEEFVPPPCRPRERPQEAHWRSHGHLPREKKTVSNINDTIAGSVPAAATETNPLTVPETEVEVSWVESELIGFFRDGAAPVFHYDTEKGKRDAQDEGLTPTELEAERRQWVEAHADLRGKIEAFLKGSAHETENIVR